MDGDMKRELKKIEHPSQYNKIIPLIKEFLKKTKMAYGLAETLFYMQNCTTYILKIDGRPIGYIAYQPTNVMFKNMVFVFQLYVRPGHHEDVMWAFERMKEIWQFEGYDEICCYSRRWRGLCKLFGFKEEYMFLKRRI